MNEPILISRREASKLLGISLRTLDYLIAGKEISCRRIGRRTLLSVASLRAFARHDRRGKRTTPNPANGDGQRIGGVSNER